MIRRPPRSTRTDTLFPYTTLFRSICVRGIEITSIVQASEHAQWIALARLFLVSEARVLFPEIIAHEIDRRIRTGFETKGASQRIEVPSVDRSEERRVGEEGVSTCGSRCGP